MAAIDDALLKLYRQADRLSATAPKHHAKEGRNEDKVLEPLQRKASAASDVQPQIGQSGPHFCAQNTAESLHVRLSVTDVPRESAQSAQEKFSPPPPPTPPSAEIPGKQQQENTQPSQTCSGLQEIWPNSWSNVEPVVCACFDPLLTYSISTSTTDTAEPPAVMPESLPRGEPIQQDSAWLPQIKSYGANANSPDEGRRCETKSATGNGAPPDAKVYSPRLELAGPHFRTSTCDLQRGENSRSCPAAIENSREPSVPRPHLEDTTQYRYFDVPNSAQPSKEWDQAESDASNHDFRGGMSTSFSAEPVSAATEVKETDTQPSQPARHSTGNSPCAWAHPENYENTPPRDPTNSGNSVAFRSLPFCRKEEARFSGDKTRIPGEDRGEKSGSDVRSGKAPQVPSTVPAQAEDHRISAPPEDPDWPPAYCVERVLWPSAVIRLGLAASSAIEAIASRTDGYTERYGRAVGFTSFSPGQGTTTLLLAVARYFLTSGRSVAVVDAAWDHPTVCQRLGILPEAGWQEFLAGRLPLAEVTVRSLSESLFLLPWTASLEETGLTGRTERQKEALRQLVTRLTSKVDITLVDLGVLEAQAAGGKDLRWEFLPLLAGVITVWDVRQEVHQRRGIWEAQILAAGGRVLGTAENFVGLRRCA